MIEISKKSKFVMIKCNYNTTVVPTFIQDLSNFIIANNRKNIWENTRLIYSLKEELEHDECSIKTLKSLYR